MALRPGMRSVARTPSPLLFPPSRTGLAVLMAAGLAAGAALPRAALAQAGAAATSAVQRPFQVPAGPLAAALTAFAADAGVSISAPPALVQGRRTQGVQGRLTVREALDRLLAGTDLQAQAAGEGGFVLRAVPEATQASTVLGEVRVTAAAPAESPWGSTSGYVARRASTATKTDASILEVAQSVSVITRDRMDDQGVRTLNDAVQYTAGVRTNTGGANPADDSLSVRGFSQFSGNFYLDGLRLMPLGTLGFFGMEPYGAERMEVLKGPASVLYGQNSPGGIVNFVSKRPSADAVRGMELSVGSHARRQAAFDLGGPVGDDGTVSYRLVGLARAADQQIDFMRDDRVYLAPSLTWAPDARTSVTLRGFYQKNHAMMSTNVQWDALNGRNPNGRLPLNRFLGEPGFDREETEVASLGYDARHEFDSGWTLRQNFRYLHARNHEQYMFRYGPLIDGSITNREIDSRDGKGGVYTVDTSLSGQFAAAGLQHELIVGLDYNRSRSSFDSYIADGPQLDIYRPVYGSFIDTSLLQPDALRDERAQQVGLYVQDRIRKDRWVLALGGRHDWSRLEQSSRLADPLSTSVRKPKSFTGRVGLTYLADNGVAPYVSYSESFVPLMGADRNDRPFDPETGKQVEVGVKYSPDEHSSFTLAAFELRRQNVLTTDPENVRYSIQQGEVRSRGIEFEAAVQPTRGLKLLAALTYNPVKVTRAQPDQWGGNVQGKSPYEVPRKMASAWVDYAFGGDLLGLGAGVGARYIGWSWGDADNSFRVPSFTLVDASLRYDLGKMRSDWRGASVSLTVKNLFDKYHTASCFSANACNYGEARNMVVRFGYIW